MTPWTTVIQQWTLDGLYQRINRPAVRLLVSGTSDLDTDAKATSAGLNKMYDFYRQKLINLFIATYSDTLDEVSLNYTRDVERIKEFNNYKTSVADANEAVSQTVFSSGLTLQAFPPGTSLIVPSGGVFGVTTGVRPALYFFDSSTQPINSSLLAGQTQPGDRAGDTFGNMVYINQGSTAVPVWNRADDANLINNILNYSELLEPGYARAVAFIKGYAVDADDGEFEFRLKNMPDAVKVKVSEVKELETEAFAILKVDTTGLGIQTDPDRRATRRKKRFY